jgi:opacity protein-like surface antigen
MRSKPYLVLALAVIFVCAGYSAFAQTAPAATEATPHLAIGAGFSGYNPDYGHGHLLGGTLWIDYSPNLGPPLLHGFGIEVEARDLNYGRSSSQPANLREDAAGGGVIYSWHRYRNIRPYGKVLIGYGNADYGEDPLAAYNHQTRTVTSEGGGLEYRVSQSIWVRADYEYQTWPDFFKNTAPAGKLNPQGFTVGALYHFGSRHSR